MRIRILALGDVIGRPGRDALTRRLPDLLKKEQVDLCVVNGENVANGSGLFPNDVEAILKAGADVVTTGDHVWRRREVMKIFASEPRLIRPGNLPPECPGKGIVHVVTRSGYPVAVINLIGRVFMDPVDCPFKAADKLVNDAASKAKVVVVDFHAEATSEKIAMGWHLDGRASFLVGTHTHIPTADERVLPKGTAYVTDLGMTGPYDSVIGRTKESVLYNFTTRMHARFDVAEGDVRICGALATIETDSGKAVDVRRVMIGDSVGPGAPPVRGA
ncbi:MAG: TIGR00282 family metallophosphoesterase [Planctomycetota bacterium]